MPLSVIGALLHVSLLLRAELHVRYSEFGGCPLFGCCYRNIYMETAVGACTIVRYSVDVRYWECPLIETPLYMYKVIKVAITR